MSSSKIHINRCAFVVIFYICYCDAVVLLYHTENSQELQYFDCIYYTRLLTRDNIQGIKYCQQLNNSHRLDRNPVQICENNGTLWKFSDLRQLNFTATDVVKWSSSVEQADRYAKYLLNSAISQEENENYICNCTKSGQFGKYCEYMLYLDSLLFDEAISKQFDLYGFTPIGSQLHNNRPCYQAHFECDFGSMCLDWRHICDGKQQCMNGTDEEYCDKLEFNECEDDEYRCANGMCIAEEYWLDTDYDCMDWTDEGGLAYSGFYCPFQTSMSCDEHLCPYDQWSCGDGTCLSDRADRLKGIYIGRRHHCFNFRDVNYICETATRYEKSWWTIDGGYCIPYHLAYNWLGFDSTAEKSGCVFYSKCALTNGLDSSCNCNTTEICALAMDTSCHELVELLWYPLEKPLLNPYTTMIYNRKRDWRNKRPDYLTYIGSIKCIGYQINIKNGIYWELEEIRSLFMHKEHEGRLCSSNFQQLYNDYFLKKFSGPQYDRNCWSNSTTFNNILYETSFRCHDRCISKYRIRDGIADCYPHEEGFNEHNTCQRIQRHRLKCSVTEPTCLLTGVIGNVNPVCSNARDEFDYESHRSLLNITCTHRNDPMCSYIRNYITTSSMLDKTMNLTVHSLNLLSTIPFPSFCDTVLDTSSGIDELTNLCQQVWICSKDEYQCLSGQCIPQDWICDGDWDCSDASDEEGIFRVESLSKHNLAIMEWSEIKGRCNRRYQKHTVPFAKMCDISKEYPCFRADVDDPFDFKVNPPCINLTQIGDHHVDCQTGLDERNLLRCGSIGLLGFNFVFNGSYNNECGEYPYLCMNRYPWAPKNVRVAYDTVCFYRKSQYNNGTLSACNNLNDVMCLNDVCIKNARCNGILECENGEDEYRCISPFMAQAGYRPMKETRSRTLTWKAFPSTILLAKSDIRNIEQTDGTSSNETLENIKILSLRSKLKPDVREKYATIYDFLRHWFPEEVTLEKHFLPYICNRGLAVKHSLGSTKCFCPPSYYGEQCQFYSDRITVVTHLDLTSYRAHLQVALIKVLAIFLYEASVIDYYEFHVNRLLEAGNNHVKQSIYFLYPRTKNFLEIKRANRSGTQLYSVRFEAFNLYYNETIEPIAVWHYPVYFDFLPAYRLSKILRFRPLSSSFPVNGPCVKARCGNHGTCQVILNSNHSSYFCACHNNFYGSNCEHYDEGCIGRCSPNSICKPSYSGIVTGNRKPICLCPYSAFGPTCSLKNDVCKMNPCLHGGSCILTYLPHDILNYTCICSDSFIGDHCQLSRGRIQINVNLSENSLVQRSNIFASTISYNDYNTKSFAFALQHQQVYTSLPVRIDLVYSRQYNTAPAVGLLKIYNKNYDFDEPEYFIVYIAQQQMFLNFSTDLTSENKCVLIKFGGKYCKSSAVEFTFSSNSSIDIYTYHGICHSKQQLNTANRPTLTCFRDKNYLCICEKDYSRAECFIYNRSSDQCSLCLSNGFCLKGELNDRADFLCLCSHCYYGQLCQFSTAFMSFTLESLIVKDLHSQRQLSSGMYITMGVILFLVGLFNNYCSLMTFIRPKTRKFGIGNYLLIVSIVNQLSLLFLLLKIIHTVLGSTSLLVNYELFNQYSCKIVSYLLSVFTRICNWLTSLVSIERLCIVLFPTSFALRKPPAALGLSAIVILVISGMHVHELIYYTVIIHPSYTSVNITLCYKLCPRSSIHLQSCQCSNSLRGLLYNSICFGHGDDYSNCTKPSTYSDYASRRKSPIHIFGYLEKEI
ncbi:unnamed protein product [Rotaria magnacalcarata]|uniref:Uncharacterized protein n=1 Tax=Rotaria magnacalcarata TaxID=392030 RepID=A0A814FTG4_9BILA|nr:unnamed protein product [Rotaria magnacalcarata]CAF2169461.1 unnamed protein product [Rotaria magnacalcarata]CAF3954018.1 unnamed protein product [Rotaria magnacalcarata]CAF3965396.1 unnamed protein product [Rotaria magnacalcarata]